MAEASPSQRAQQDYRNLAADRIKELSSANENVPQVLRSAATALSSLTNSPIIDQTSPSPNPTDSTSLRKLVFERNVQTFFTLITQTKEKLHDQINALEASNVIPSEQLKFVSATIAPPGQGGPAPEAKLQNPEASMTNGGMGDLDIGILNARAGILRQEMDGELLGRVRGVLEELVKGMDEDRTMVDG
ncbi:hypothetical protein K469DRAFT_682547 [Zopfia rhizophila CBS 207.26]|uniref:Mediator of RNA polymerase II transcription subunit 11 n=1 Tax=Zopfia rhizophila CBS 207.26 TaxID=1314779 RepID=A0A6A6DA13_9PEZI|nr:hypothetical protein K469DRAFT_682547 [Zopfia rhizophila CBS 207.26]